MSYGGGAMMGIMHAEIAQKRRWLSDARYLEGVSLVTLLPGPPAVQLAIFIGYDRAGWRGGVLTGLSFMLPAFFILLGLTLLYSAYGDVGPVRGAFEGIGAVVIGIFAAAVFRLGKTALKDRAQIAIAGAAVLLAAATPIGVATILLLAACAGVARYHARAQGIAAAAVVAALAAMLHLALPLVTGISAAGPQSADPASPSLWQLAAFFLKVSALTFGGGIAIVAFVQEHVVEHAHWLTAREFLDGLALGQLTPGPTLMIAAYVGYKLAGFAGATVSALCIFAPAFFLVLPLMPLLGRFQQVSWIKAAMRGVTPAVIGVLVVALAQLLPHAAPDAFRVILLIATAVGLMVWRIGPLALIAGAGVLGLLVRLRPF